MDYSGGDCRQETRGGEEEARRKSEGVTLALASRRSASFFVFLQAERRMSPQERVDADKWCAPLHAPGRTRTAVIPQLQVPEMVNGSRGYRLAIIRRCALGW